MDISGPDFQGFGIWFIKIQKNAKDPFEETEERISILQKMSSELKDFFKISTIKIYLIKYPIVIINHKRNWEHFDHYYLPYKRKGYSSTNIMDMIFFELERHRKKDENIQLAGWECCGNVKIFYRKNDIIVEDWSPSTKQCGYNSILSFRLSNNPDQTYNLVVKTNSPIWFYGRPVWYKNKYRDTNPELAKLNHPKLEKIIKILEKKFNGSINEGNCFSDTIDEKLVTKYGFKNDFEI